MVHLLSSEVRQLLHNKFVVVLGDSVQRSVYKDLVLLLQKDCLLTHRQLKGKGEMSFEQDELVVGGQKSPMHNRTSYREVRQYRSGHHLVRFYFLTRVYNEYVRAVLAELQADTHSPDVLILNSCLWDISRYGPHSVRSYRQNLESLFRHLGQALPASCLLLWTTALPVGQKITGGFLLPEQQQQPLARRLRLGVIEANFYSSAEAERHGLDVLDLHFHFRHADRHRQGDGVHWNQHAHRRLSQLLLAHLADAWGVDLPRRDPVGKWIKEGRTPAGLDRQAQASGDPQVLPPTPALPPRRLRPLLPLPAPRPPLPLPPLLPAQPRPISPHPVMSPQFLPCPQDTYFSSDQSFQSDQFFLSDFHSDVPSSTQTGLDFEADSVFSPQPPRPSFPTPYQQWAPVVHRGFPRTLPRGPYVPWRRRPKSHRKRTPALPEPRPH